MSLKDNFDYDPNSLDFDDALSFILKNIPILSQKTHLI